MKPFLLSIFFSLPVLLFSQEQKKLPRLFPDHVKVQYAGAIGLVSLGLGYESPNKRFQGDFYYGYVPKKYGGEKPIHSVTGKFTWMAIPKMIAHDLRIDILNVGVFMNYSFGKQYFLFKPDNYSYGYYGFPTALNGSLFVGSSVTHGRIGLYYEVGISGKDALGYVKNTKSLAFSDILHAGIGTRIGLK